MDKLCGWFLAHVVNDIVKAKAFAKMKFICGDLLVSTYGLERELRIMDTVGSDAYVHLMHFCVFYAKVHHEFCVAVIDSMYTYLHSTNIV